MRRLVSCLLALVAFVGLSLTAPQPAAADGIAGGGAKIACELTGAGVLDKTVGKGWEGKEIPGHGKVKKVPVDPNEGICDVVGRVVQKKVDAAWKSVWDSVLGDVIKSAADAVKWVIKKVLTVALLGPSLDLAGSGLFGRDATLAGMLTWLGLVIATAGAMWQIGKMAITGQTKHLGRAMLGWVENTILSAVGVGLIAVLVSAGDALTTGLVNKTFDNGGQAYDRIVAVLVPAAVSNPITMLCVVAVLLLIGFIQLIMVFLRQSSIPIQCLLLPVAGGGRTGGDATRSWAPRLITSICVTIVYKPMLAIIICTGFSEFGHAHTLAEWLRGCATLVLGVIAPGPLTKLFAPFGEAVGAGLASGGASGAFASAGSFLAGRMSKGGDDGDDGGAQPTSAVDRAKYVEQIMGRQGGQGGQGGAGEDGGSGGQGSDAQSQAARNNANVGQGGARVPGQGGEVTPNAGTTTGTQTGQVAAGAGNTASSVAPAVGVGIQVMDGLNRGVQGASGQIGNGGNTQ
ncbi:hypothetical protein ACWDBD_36825 [Streptomyces sp. NPDC001118]